MLLVGDDEPQRLKLGGFGDQGVGAHGHLNLAAEKLFPDLALFLLGHGAGEQPHGDAQGSKKLSQGGEMLLRQNLRGSHEGCLVPVADGAERRRGGNHGLAAAHISLNQPVHGSAPAQIRQNFTDSTLLGPGEGEGEGIIKIG